MPDYYEEMERPMTAQNYSKSNPKMLGFEAKSLEELAEKVNEFINENADITKHVAYASNPINWKVFNILTDRNENRFGALLSFIIRPVPKPIPQIKCCKCKTSAKRVKGNYLDTDGSKWICYVCLDELTKDL